MFQTEKDNHHTNTHTHKHTHAHIHSLKLLLNLRDCERETLGLNYRTENGQPNRETGKGQKRNKT